MELSSGKPRDERTWPWWWVPIAAAVVLAGTLAFTLPLMFLEPIERERAARLLDMRRLLPSVVTWALTATVLVVSLLFASVLSVAAIRAGLAQQRGARDAVTAVAVLSAIGYFVYDVTIRADYAPAFGTIFGLLGNGDTRLEPLYWSARVTGALGVSTSIMVATAVWSLVGGIRQLEVRDLRMRMRRLVTLLGLSSAGLASGGIATSSRLQLQIDYSMSQADIDNALHVASASTVGYGGFFTLILLGIFLPSAWVMRSAGESLARSEHPVSIEAQKKWLADHGLVTSMVGRLASMLAAFAPLLSSALSSGITSAVAAVGS